MALRRGRRRALTLAALAAVIALILTSCGSKVDDATTASAAEPHSNLLTSTGPPKRGGTLVFGLSAESNGWNTSFNQWGPSGLTVARAIFDTMATFDEHGDVKPFLLESFTPSDNFTTWTLKLRPGIKLHNGKPVTATTIVRNQMFLKSSAQAGVLYRQIDRFEAVDDLTVKAYTTVPDTVFPMLLGSQLGVVVDPDWLESGDSLHPIGTGPFMLDSWTIGKKLVVKRNPNYRRKDANGESLPYLDGIEFPVIPDSSQMTSALRAGDVDAIQSMDTGQYDTFRADEAYQEYAPDRAQQPESAIALNTSKAPFDDLDARRALALATDRAALLEMLGMRADQATDGPFPQDSPFFTDAGFPRFDLDQATRLATKVKGAHGSFSFTLVTTTDPFATRLAQVLQQQWQAAGIDVQISNIEAAPMLIRVVTGDYQAMTWTASLSPDPREEATAFWAPPSKAGDLISLNLTRFQDPAVEKAVNDAMATQDPATIKDQIAVIQRRFADQVPWIWLYRQPQFVLANRSVVNVVNWTLPDGTPAQPLYRGGSMLAQAWLAR
jgi:ABC-type transport system substrate-binding protein